MFIRVTYVAILSISIFIFGKTREGWWRQQTESWITSSDDSKKSTEDRVHFFFFFHTSHVLVFVSTPDPSRPPQADSWPFLVSVITCGQGHCVLCGSIRRSAVCRLFSILNSFIRFFLSELKNIYFQWWRPLWRHNSYVSISTPRDIGLQKW